MAIEIDEPINVSAVFSGGVVRPVWFSWNCRQVKIKETTFIWTTFQGSSTILHFSVTDGKGLYELCYQSDNLHWKLARAEET
jgi:hypothetical protein